MKKANVVVCWQPGLHLRHASRLARLASGFQSRICLHLGESVADASSILSILILCASMNTVLQIETSGSDEQEALLAVEAFFQSDDPDNPGANDSRLT